jgi:REP element-mobilizing transposase RayT
MPRKTRVELAGGLHHVTTKSPSGRLLFVDDRHRRLYLELIAREVREREWSVLTYCLLTNHLHVLVRTPMPDLGLGFKRINEDFARHVNRTRDESGHVFGERFYNSLVSNDRHAVGCLRYIARNPVAAGMCGSADDWPWSAHPALAGLAPPPQFLDVSASYAFLSSDADACAEYRRLVAQSDQALIGTLFRPTSDDWMVDAVDSYSIPVEEIAVFLDLTKRSVYRRLRTARVTGGTVPRGSRVTGGTVPGGSAEG